MMPMPSVALRYERRSSSPSEGRAGSDKKVEGVVIEKSEVMNESLDCGNSRGQT